MKARDFGTNLLACIGNGKLPLAGTLPLNLQSRTQLPPLQQELVPGLRSNDMNMEVYSCLKLRRFPAGGLHEDDKELTAQECKLGASSSGRSMYSDVSTPSLYLV